MSLDIHPSQERAMLQKRALAKAALVRAEERERQTHSLLAFVRYFWHVLEPAQPLVEGRVLNIMAQHLEAVSRGEIRRLLINVSPGSMKSLLCNVFWPLWCWSAAAAPSTRFISFSYAAHLTQRDNARMRDVIHSAEFQELWGHVFQVVEDGKVKLGNSEKGWKLASSVAGIATGERGDVLILDDPHNIVEGESEAVRTTVTRWVRESMSNRLNNMDTGVIVIIMQRVHEDDVTGMLLDEDLGYDHLCIPMKFDRSRDKVPTSIGWLDWRTEEDELAWPERFSPATVKEAERTLGPYAFAAQYQQIPEPRGGGIFKKDWWQPYELYPPIDRKTGRAHPKAGHPVLPPHYVVASLDPAFTANEENDPSGFVIWGVYRDPERTGGVAGRSVKSMLPDEDMRKLGIVSDQSTFDAMTPIYHAKCALLYAWQKWLEMHGPAVPRDRGESDISYIERAKEKWGLCEWVAYDCKRMQVDLLLVENKASGIDVYKELKRLYRGQRWGVQLIDPGILDKRSRALSIQHLFADHLISAPNRDWADMVIKEFAKFRGLPGDRDNLVDAGTQALRFLRDRGDLLRHDEHKEDQLNRAQYRRPLEPLYPDV